MQIPLQITFRHVDHSPAVEARARELVTWLERFHERIMGCHVVIEAPAAHRHKGASFNIKIDLTIPGERIAVRSGHLEGEQQVDIYGALRDAFDIARRRLQDYAQRRRES